MGDLFSYVRESYVDVSDPDLFELDEQITGYARRDRPSASPKAERTQRKRVKASAEAIREAACKAEAALEQLHDALQSFNEAIGKDHWSARMLEEVFDIPYVASTALEPPEIFDPARGFFVVRGGWPAMKHELDTLATLPVRRRLRPGRVGNQELRRALEVIRAFWQHHAAADAWTRSILNQINHADEAKKGKRSAVNQLEGRCERFVADVLTAAGFVFDLQELNGAWSSLDRELRSRTG
jgi:hypothetical protein